MSPVRNSPPRRPLGRASPVRGKTAVRSVRDSGTSNGASAGAISNGVKIRKARASDLPGILKLVRAYKAHLLQDYLPRTSKFFVAEEDGTVVGCCALEVYSKRLAEVRTLAVTKKFQGKGIASKLIYACLHLAKKKRIYEILTITGAVHLFEKHGFHTFKQEKYALLKVLG